MKLLSSIMHAVVIRRDDGSEFVAHGKPGPAVFHGLKGARAHKRELRPHFKCRVCRVLVEIKELHKARKLKASKSPSILRSKPAKDEPLPASKS